MISMAPDQKEEFRQNIRKTLESLQFIEGRAGLDMFDRDMIAEVISLDKLISALQVNLLRGFTQATLVPADTDTTQQLINEEYQD